MGGRALVLLHCDVMPQRDQASLAVRELTCWWLAAQHRVPTFWRVCETPWVREAVYLPPELHFLCCHPSGDNGKGEFS